MSSVSFGDVFFIAIVGGGIYLLLSLVNRSRKEGPSAGDKNLVDSVAREEGGPHGRSDNHS